ncbi:MAG: DeoR family transcriptional regulator [Chloroflexi bacterium]|nr:DeoR family transcriptional regulator [Chloroflexota bacterium]
MARRIPTRLDGDQRARHSTTSCVHSCSNRANTGRRATRAAARQRRCYPRGDRCRLAQRLRVSQMTIGRDLNTLADQARLRATGRDPRGRAARVRHLGHSDRPSRDIGRTSEPKVCSGIATREDHDVADEGQSSAFIFVCCVGRAKTNSQSAQVAHRFRTTTK